MALGWLTVLKMVPWDDVIKNAPRVAEGAKKLWSAVANKHPPSEPLTAPKPTSATLTLEQLQAQLTGAQLEIASLHQQMLESSVLIQTLAEQNAQLIRRVEINRIRVLALAVTVGVLLLAGVALSIVLAA